MVEVRLGLFLDFLLIQMIGVQLREVAIQLVRIEHIVKQHRVIVAVAVTVAVEIV